MFYNVDVYTMISNFCEFGLALLDISNKFIIVGYIWLYNYTCIIYMIGYQNVNVDNSFLQLRKYPVMFTLYLN